MKFIITKDYDANWNRPLTGVIPAGTILEGTPVEKEKEYTCSKVGCPCNNKLPAQDEKNPCGYF